VAETLGPKFRNNFSFLPAQGTRGGILTAVSDDHFRLISSCRTANTLSVRIQMRNDAAEWMLTGVYGPQTEQENTSFLEEIKSLRQGMQYQRKWLIGGDFNLIYRAEDKSNSKLNRRLMGKFKSVIEELELKELPLGGRNFTWTCRQNSQGQATMTRIDSLLLDRVGRALSHGPPPCLGVYHLRPLPFNFTRGNR
jgi:exonuclease III